MLIKAHHIGVVMPADQTGNMMSVNKTISPSNSAGWTITIGSGGIHSPIAKFVFTCGGKRYEISAKYRSI